MNTKATVKLVPGRDKNADGKSVIELRVTFNRRSQLYRTKCKTRLSTDEFKRFSQPRPPKNISQAFEQARESENIAKGIADKLGVNFSFPEFSRLYRKTQTGCIQNSLIFSAIAEEYISNQITQPKTKSLYTTVKNWVLLYRKNLLITDITADFVKQFVKYLKEQHIKNSVERVGKPSEMSENTVRIYLRCFRAMYNEGAKHLDSVPEDPFQIKGQPLHSVLREKAALGKTDYLLILKYEPADKLEEFGKDFFELTVQLCGANMCDILALKNKNINNGEISFIRKKTRKSGLVTVIPLTSQAETILNKYGKINPDAPDEYILPYFIGLKNLKSQENKVHDIIRKVNRGLGKISSALGIQKTTTYTARHTYASFAQSRMTADQIQKFLGHTNSRTTQIYMSSLQQDVKDINRNMLEDIGNSH